MHWYVYLVGSVLKSKLRTNIQWVESLIVERRIANLKACKGSNQFDETVKKYAFKAMREFF